MLVLRGAPHVVVSQCPLLHSPRAHGFALSQQSASLSPSQCNQRSTPPIHARHCCATTSTASCNLPRTSVGLQPAVASSGRHCAMAAAGPCIDAARGACAGRSPAGRCTLPLQRNQRTCCRAACVALVCRQHSPGVPARAQQRGRRMTGRASKGEGPSTPPEGTAKGTGYAPTLNRCGPLRR